MIFDMSKFWLKIFCYLYILVIKNDLQKIDCASKMQNMIKSRENQAFFFYSQPQPVSTELENSNPSTGASMDPQDVSRVQKLCKFASSSLDYDDVDAAIKNLTEALDLLHKSKQK